MRKDKFRKAFIAAIRLASQLWREAIESDDAHWPPPWLYFSGTILAVTVLVTLGTTILTGVLPSAGALVGSTDLGHLTTEHLQTYIEHHSAGLFISPDKLAKLWGFGGLALFIFA